MKMYPIIDNFYCKKCHIKEENSFFSKSIEIKNIFAKNINMNGLTIFVSIITLFVIGSCIGWVIEVLFRRIFSAKKWINPGFLVGPWLPIYGFGTVGLFGLSNIDLTFNQYLNENQWLIILIKILLIAAVMILVEFITGLIFIKGMKIKLWDYSNRKGNIKGIICPLFSFLWLIVGAIYYFFINPYLVKACTYLANNPIYYFFFGIIYGAILVDFAYSIHLANKIRKFAKDKQIIIKLDNFRETVKSHFDERKEELKTKLHKKPNYIFPLRNDEDITELLDQYTKGDFIIDENHQDKHDEN